MCVRLLCVLVRVVYCVSFVILGVRVLPNVFVRIVCDLSVMLYGVFCVCVFCVSVCACVSTKWLCVFVCELLCVFV